MVIFSGGDSDRLAQNVGSNIQKISQNGKFYLCLACLYKEKGNLCHTPGARPHACTRASDQNVQFLRLGQFLSNYKG